MLNTLLFLPLKIKVFFVSRISRIVEKTYCASLVISCLLYMNLYTIQLFNYSTIYHFTNKFFTVAVMFLYSKITRIVAKVTSFELRTWRTLFISFRHSWKHPFWLVLLAWSNYVEKYRTKETGVLIWIAYNWGIMQHFGPKKSYKKNWQNLQIFWTISSLYGYFFVPICLDIPITYIAYKMNQLILV